MVIEWKEEPFGTYDQQRFPVYQPHVESIRYELFAGIKITEHS